MSPLRWTTKSLTQLVKGLCAKGFAVEQDDGRPVAQAGWVPAAAHVQDQGGCPAPDRDAQFRHINATAAAFLADGDPVVSVDTKKKELVGEYANKGREWQRPGSRCRSTATTFRPGCPRLSRTASTTSAPTDGFVSVGVDHETSRSRSTRIRTWWYVVSAASATRREPAADHRRRGRLQRLPAAALEGRTGQARRRDRPGHHGRATFPLVRSKWNKVEHRLFSFISINWRGRPLTDYQVIVETIAATTTKTGLTVEAVLDPGTLPHRRGGNARRRSTRFPLPASRSTASGTTQSILDRSLMTCRIRHLV